MTKYKLGDQVKIVNYGHLYFGEESKQAVDIAPHSIGQIGIVTEAEKVLGVDKYSLAMPSNCKQSWYDNGQLELVYRPSYK